MKEKENIRLRNLDTEGAFVYTKERERERERERELLGLTALTTLLIFLNCFFTYVDVFMQELPIFI